MIGWFDAHNHVQDPRFGGSAPIIDAMKAAGVTGCVVNAITEADWEELGKLARAEAGFVAPAFGVHPWHAGSASSGWSERLAEILNANPEASIGECGLDRCVSTPALGIQVPVFREHLRLARELHRPITIHCVRAWEPLLDALQQCLPPCGFLMHSFGGSIETARRLLSMGARFSFSGAFLHARRESARRVFQQLPRERILVETDAPDMAPPLELVTHPLPDGCNHPANLPSIGSKLARLLATDPDDFAGQTAANAKALFRMG